MVVVSFAVLIGILALSVLPATLRARTERGQDAQFALVPSDAEPVADRLSFDAVERYRARGELLLVTIRQPEITLFDWIVSDGLPEVRLLSYTDKFGEQTPGQQEQFGFEMMRSAKETAEYVALSHLGYPAKIIPGDVIVQDLVCLRANADQSACAEYAPSADVLEPGDKLLSVDGVDVHLIDDLGPILEKHQPGDVVSVEYERVGVGTRDGDIELIASDDGTDRTIIGFQPFDTASADLPFEVDIASGAIGGPSAGLAFTLTLIDELTPGELTGGIEVAVTGEIEVDGSVGAIGGLVSKTSAVKQRGAELFIVPSAQGETDIAAARAVAGDDLRIVAVDNLDQALAVLAEYGGNGLDLGTPGADYQVPA
jgi:Lon-like protease